MRPPATRRQLLAALGAAALAGCPASDSDAPAESPGPTRSTDETSAQRPTTTSEDRTIDLLTDYYNEQWVAKWEDDIVPAWNERSTVPLRVENPRGIGDAEDFRQAVDRGEPPELRHGTLTQYSKYLARGEFRAVDGLVDDLVGANGELVCESAIRAGEEAMVVPHGLYLGTLTYRQDVYDRLDLSVPETWAELLENARTIDEAETVDARGYALPATDPELSYKAGWSLLTWLYNAGGRVFRWAGESGDRVTVDFQPRHVRPALEHMRALSAYSPDPSEIGWGDTIGAWVRGEVAQCIFPNAWLAGEAAHAERAFADEVAVTTPPTRDRSLDPFVRGYANADGALVFAEAESVDAAESFLRFMYRGPDRHAEHLLQPTRFLPPYEGVARSDTYRQSPQFRNGGSHLLALNDHCLETIAPQFQGDRARTRAAWHALDLLMLAGLVRSVIVDEAPIDEAVSRTRSRLRERLETGRELG